MILLKIKIILSTHLLTGKREGVERVGYGTPTEGLFKQLIKQSRHYHDPYSLQLK